MTERERYPTGAPAGPPLEATRPVYSTEPVAWRGPESPGGLLLLLAGVAAALSLALDRLRDTGTTGWDLVTEGVEDLSGSIDDGLWQPLAVVVGGGLLFLLGILLWLPARSHRLLGLVALLVSGLVVWAVVVPLADAGWDLDGFGPGFWCGPAVAVLGVLGSLKALLTGRRHR